MEQDLKLRLLESIGKVYEQSRDCKLEPAFFKKVEPELKFLSDYLKVTRNQAFIVAMVFALHYHGDTVDLNALIRYLDCNPMKILEFSDDFEALHSKDILQKQKFPHLPKTSMKYEQLTINEKITKAILKNKPMPETEKERHKDVTGLLEELYKLSEQRYNEEINSYMLFSIARYLITSNLHYPLIKKISDYRLSAEDAYLFTYMIWRTVAGEESITIREAAEDIFDNGAQRVNYIQTVISQKNKLISENHLEVIEASFFNDARIKLSGTSVKMLAESGLKLFFHKKRHDNIIEPAKITAKMLYYNDFERQQLNLVKSLLQEKSLKETQSRLQKKGLPTGITILLHGLPGTGKTETALQIARGTNREIMKVDISQSKSMWYGESEKIIKRIFTDYKAFSKECELMPVLLFNEADAIISRRLENIISDVDQTENTIQNIILEELENFEGILFATTNLVRNFDSAFERRFLFKIELQKPGIPVKAKIWSSKLPALSQSECEALAARFDFSGGQIDNIVRKSEIHEIIRGVSVNLSHIIDFCKTEVLSKHNGVRIGFTKNRTPCQKEKQLQGIT